MKTILIPTDFSPTAINAADYAIGYAKQLRIENIILYNAWQPLNMSDPMSTLVVSEVDAVKLASSTQLAKEVKRLSEFAPLHFNIETVSEMAVLEDGIARLCKEKEISYIIMGITGGGTLDEKLIGSNTITVSQNTNVPLIIVPADSKFKYISKVMFLSDFKDIGENVPVDQLKMFLEDTLPQLDVINFDPDFNREQAEPALEKFALHQILRKYSPEYKYSLRNDFEDAVNEFAENDNVQIIINVAKKHGWLYRILHPSYTKKLAFHTNVPLMVIHA